MSDSVTLMIVIVASVSVSLILNLGLKLGNTRGLEVGLISPIYSARLSYHSTPHHEACSRPGCSPIVVSHFVLLPALLCCLVLDPIGVQFLRQWMSMVVLFLYDYEMSDASSQRFTDYLSDT